MRVNKALSALTVAGAMTLVAGSASATWSIVIVDTRTGEMAAGSATCLTGFNLKNDTPVMVLGRGAATAQALLEPTGITRSDLRHGLLQGDHPDAILNTLRLNDNGHQDRQYGLVDVQGRAMTFSGLRNNNWAGGVTGRIERGAPGPADDIVYAIQGNILTGEGVVLAAEAAILASTGDIAEMLMDSMWAARITGGDGRCSCDAGPTDCGTPPGDPDEFKSADVGYMIVGRLGDPNASKALYRFEDFSTMVGFDLDGNGTEELLAFPVGVGPVSTYTYLDSSVPGALGIERGPDITLPILRAHTTAVGDVTGDGLDDLVVVGGLGEVWVLPRASSGGLDLGAMSTIDGLVGVSDLLMLDLDGLGGLDLVAVNENFGQIIPIAGGATSTLVLGAPIQIAGVTGPIHAGDLDNDGDADLVAMHTGSGGVRVLTNNSDGTVSDSGVVSTSGVAIDAMIMDLEGDGAGELVVIEEGSRDLVVLGLDGAERQTLRAGLNPQRFLEGSFTPGVEGEVTVVSGGMLVVVGPDGAGGLAELSLERTQMFLGTAIPLDLNGDGLDEVVTGMASPINPTLLIMFDNDRGQFNAPRGWADSKYWLTLNVANTVRSDPDPVETLRFRYDLWRDKLAGHVDAVISEVEREDGGAMSVGQRSVYTARLSAYPGVPITTSPVVTAETSDGTVARVVSVVALADDEFEITVEGVGEGAASLRVIADDGQLRPVVLMPEPRIEVVSMPADVNGDGVVNQADLKEFIRMFVSGDPAADINGDGAVGMGDVAAFIESFLEATGRGRGRFK